MTTPDIKASVIEELENRDILPNKFVSNVIENKSDLGKHVSAVAAADDQTIAGSPTIATLRLMIGEAGFVKCLFLNQLSPVPLKVE